MLRNVAVLTIALLFLSLNLIDARAEEILTWEGCLEEARQNHPDLISAKEQLNQARASKAINQSSIWPQITGNVSGKTAKSSSRVTTDTYAYDITGKQLLFDGFKTAYDIASASEDVKSAEYNYAVTSSSIRLDLRAAFVELLKAQELLSITEDIAARRKQNLELVQLRYEAGREHRGALLNAQANLAQAEFEVKQAQRNIALAQRQLVNELGRKKLASINVRGEFIVNSLNKTKPEFEHLAESNPFLQELIAKKEAARFDLKSAQAEFFPQVYANGSIGRTDCYWPARNEVWSGGVSLSLPIFEGGSRIAEVSQARAALNQAQADARSGRDSVIFTLEEAWKEFQDAVDKVEVEQKFLQASEERARITQEQYSIGLVSFDDWSIIEDNLVSAKKSYLNAKANALVAEATWIQAKGGTLDYVEE